MPIDEVEFSAMKGTLSRLGKKTAALVKIAKETDCTKPDYPGRGCELLENATRPWFQRQGGKRKSRKKRRKRKSRRKTKKRRRSRRRKSRRRRR